jgi:hypothetical protein
VYVMLQFRDEGEGISGCWEGDDADFVIVTRSSRYMDRARPMTSKPGPDVEIRKGCPTSCLGSQYTDVGR